MLNGSALGLGEGALSKIRTIEFLRMSKSRYLRNISPRAAKLLVEAERRSHLLAGGPSFDIGGESSLQRKIRGIRKLGESGSAGERDAANELLKRLGGPLLPKV